MRSHVRMFFGNDSGSKLKETFWRKIHIFFLQLWSVSGHFVSELLCLRLVEMHKKTGLAKHIIFFSQVSLDYA